MIFYTVYLKRTDEIIASGSSISCAKQMNKSLNGFHSIVSKNTKGKQHKYEILKENLSLDDSENDEF